MPDALTSAMLALVARAPGAAIRLGRVTAVDTATAAVTVDLAGQSVPGVRWVSSYSPAAGDFVVVVRADAAWVVLGKLSRDLTSGARVYDSITVLPSYSRWGRDGWSWYGGAEFGVVAQRGAAGTATEAGVIGYDLAAGGVLPGGATIESARLRVTRAPTVMDDGPDLVSPRIYAHTYTYPDPTSGAPTWTPGYGPWEPGTLRHGESGTWELPSGWMTALLAGTIRGLGVQATQLAQSAAWSTEALSWSIQINYSTPA